MGNKKLAKKINGFLTMVLIVLLLPLFFTIAYQNMQIEQLLGNVRITETAEETERLIGIAAKEINANAPLECIKAQCVIARTNLRAAEENGTETPEALSGAEMHKIWGEHFSNIYKKMETAVTETAGETLQYKNTYIYAAYHAVSAGNTRNIKEMYPDSDMPYLKSTACYEDCGSKDYLEVCYWTEEEFLNLCTEKFPDAQVREMSDIAILEKDSTGYVTRIQAGEKTYEGETFRKAIGLNSSNFTLAERDGNVRIVTKGLGHGVGLSQYTAEKMADAGNSYRDILNYFFPGAKLQSEK